MKVHGYVIVQPQTIGLKDPFVPHFHTFSDSAARAWRYWIGFGPNVNEIDVSTYIQRWHDRGYRVKRAVMEIED